MLNRFNSHSLSSLKNLTPRIQSLPKPFHPTCNPTCNPTSISANPNHNHNSRNQIHTDSNSTGFRNAAFTLNSYPHFTNLDSNLSQSSSARNRAYSTNSTKMSIEQSIREKLERELDIIKLNIRNDSSKHSHHAAMVAQGGGSGETHFFIEIISDSFKDKNQLSRHRLINNLLKEEFERGLHALSLRLKTGEEEERGVKA